MYIPLIKEFPPMTMAQLERLYTELPRYPTQHLGRLEHDEILALLLALLRVYYPVAVVHQLADDLKQFCLAQTDDTLPVTSVHFNRPIDKHERPGSLSLHPIILGYMSPDGSGPYVNQFAEAQPYLRLLTYTRAELARHQFFWRKNYAVEIDPQYLVAMEQPTSMLFHYDLPPELSTVEDLVLYGDQFDKPQRFSSSSGPSVLSLLLPPVARDKIWHHVIDSFILVDSLTTVDELATVPGVTWQTLQIQTHRGENDVVFLRISFFQEYTKTADSHTVFDYTFKPDLCHPKYAVAGNTMAVYAYPPARYIVTKGAALAFPPPQFVTRPAPLVDVNQAARDEAQYSAASNRLGLQPIRVGGRVKDLRKESIKEDQSKSAVKSDYSSTTPASPYLLEFDFTEPDQLRDYLNKVYGDPANKFKIPENVKNDIQKLLSVPRENVKYSFKVTRYNNEATGKVTLICTKQDWELIVFEYIGHNVR